MCGTDGAGGSTARDSLVARRSSQSDDPRGPEMSQGQGQAARQLPYVHLQRYPGIVVCSLILVCAYAARYAGTVVCSASTCMHMIGRYKRREHSSSKESRKDDTAEQGSVGAAAVQTRPAHNGSKSNAGICVDTAVRRARTAHGGILLRTS